MEAATKSRSLGEQREAEAAAGDGESKGEGGAVEHEGDGSGAGSNGNGGDGAHKADLEGEGDGEKPGKGDGKEKVDAKPTLVLEGEKSLNLRVGGDDPQVSSANLKTKMISIPQGQYEKNDEVDVVLRLRCCNVSFPDKRSGGSLFTERKHEFEVLTVERVK